MSTRIHEIYIRATAEAIWEALTTPEWTSRYGYRSSQHYELKPGGAFQAKANTQMRQMGLPELIIDGEVIEAHAPRKLVQTYRFLFSDANKAEGFTRITWRGRMGVGHQRSEILVGDRKAAKRLSGV